MIAEALKKALLQAAIQGKLTEQLPEDGDARDLLKEIHKEKARLVKEGKIKKEKPLPDITEDEIPFDIPENWAWARLGDANVITMGQSPDGSSVGMNNGIEFHQGKIFFTDKYIGDSELRCNKPTKIAQAGSILLCVRAPVGVVNITNREICIGRGLTAIIPFSPVDREYLYYYLITLKRYFVEKSTGSTFKAISQNTISAAPIPIPPLAEQKRIVEKLESLLLKIEALQVEENKLDKLEKAFPGKIRASILQAAIQGKLTEQLPEDGYARDLLKEIQKEKARLIKEGKIKKANPLPEITEDEIPFDIPDNWVWVRLGDVVLNARSGGTPDTKTSKYYGGNIPFVTIKDMTIAEKYIDVTLSHITELGLENSSAWLVEKNHILYSMYASIGKVSINTIPLATSQAIIALQLIDNDTLRNYIYFYLRSLEALIYRFAAGTTQLNINAKIVKELLIPLPSVEEQKRIVGKLEELIPLCERLE